VKTPMATRTTQSESKMCFSDHFAISVGATARGVALFAPMRS